MRLGWAIGCVVLALGAMACGDDDEVAVDAGRDASVDGGGVAAGGVDGGEPEDAGEVDASADDAGTDGGPTDAGSDAGSEDAGTDAGAEDAGPIVGGDCASPADCEGRPCVELVPGGWRVCEDDIPEATSCTGSELDECCETADCSEGACYEAPVVPFCGGILPAPRNVCASDLCENDGDCTGAANRVCLPANVLDRPVRSCFFASCRQDDDCSAEANGRCMPVRDPCCGNWSALTCVYDDGCRTNADCPGGHCRVNGDRAECAEGPPICPA